MTSITLGILDCDEIAPELQSDYHNYAEMFRRLLAGLDPQLDFKSYAVVQGRLPTQPDACDAYLVTGSKTGVYDNDAWLDPLAQFVKGAYQFGTPLAGICFGHQFLCHHLGGHAEKSDKGWGIGVLAQERQTHADWLGAMPESLSLLYSHQDQVQALPEHVTRLYGSEFCPNGAVWQAGRLLTFQGHPEFTKDYSKRLMGLRQDRYPPELYERAVLSLAQATDEAFVAESLIRFFRGEDSQ